MQPVTVKVYNPNYPVIW